MGIPATWSGFQATDCCICGVGFAMETGLYAQRRADRKSFWCPNGHSQHFTGETDDERQIAHLRRQLEIAQADARRAQQSREWAEQRTKGANIAAGLAKAAKRRLEQRVSR